MVAIPLIVVNQPQAIGSRMTSERRDGAVGSIGSRATEAPGGDGLGAWKSGDGRRWRPHC
jgi:hypothetical protein